jgi:hypothetical protein
VSQFRRRLELRRRLRTIRQVSRAIAAGQAGDGSLSGLEADLLALQREGEVARGLTLGGQLEPGNP